MNGKRYLLDTNAVIQLLAGNPSLRKMVEDSDFLAISVISKLEFLSYPDLTEDEKIAFYELLEDLTVFDLTASDDALIQEAVSMRIDGGLSDSIRADSMRFLNMYGHYNPDWRNIQHHLRAFGMEERPPTELVQILREHYGVT